jgi:hypothetical protein
LLSLGISISFISLLHANADEIYYTNNNNVSMTEAQYDFFGEMFWDGYQDIVTQAQYNRYLTNGYFDADIVKNEYDEELTASFLPGAELNATVHETGAKKLAISKACSGSLCAIGLTLQWKGTPNVKSYDVIGALLYGNFTITSEPDTTLHYSGGNLNYGDEYYVGDGFGTSVKLQNSTTLMKIAQDFDVYGIGTIYGSYQHAKQNITKATSQLYTVGLGGYGGVFHFYGAASGKFDQMGGVYTVIS